MATLLVFSALPFFSSVAGAATVNLGPTLHAGTTMTGSPTSDYLTSPNGTYHLEMQSDGNLVLYQNWNVALWASGTAGHPGARAVLQGTDGNLVVYSGNTALWSSHTYPFPSDVLQMQSDGNAVLYNGSTPLWNTATAANIRNCWVSNNCSIGEFANEMLGIQPQAPYPGVNAPLTPANNYAISAWTRAEGMNPSACNPLATMQTEPGSSNYNSAGVQKYANYGGQTCWYWGLVATSQAIHNGRYPAIISALQNPVNNSHDQCVRLAQAVGSTPWGSGNFSALC